MEQFDNRRLQLNKYNRSIPVQQFLPIEFAGSETTVGQIKATCHHCGKTIHASQLRGEIQELYNNIHLINAVGYCVECGTYSDFYMRVKLDSTDGAIVVESISDRGRWLQKKVSTTEDVGKFPRLLKFRSSPSARQGQPEKKSICLELLDEATA